LPPPSYYQFSSPEDSDVDDEDGDDSDFTFDSTKAPVGFSVAARANTESLASSIGQRAWKALENSVSTSSPSAPRSSNSDDGSYNDESDELSSKAAVVAADLDDASVHLPATVRTVEPAIVHFRERGLETAHRSAVEIAAGSSSVMAKKGSGSKSPAVAQGRTSPRSQKDKDKDKVKGRVLAVKRASLKRNRRSDDSVELRKEGVKKSPKRGKQSSSATPESL
jgi:hypothetical protein